MSKKNAFEDLAYYLHKVAAQSDTQRNRLFKEHIGISNVQYMLLRTLKNGIDADRPTQQDITDELGITKGTLSRQVLIAYKKGWIYVEKSKISRRENVLTLTNKGRDVLSRAQAAVSEGTAAIQSLLPAQDLRTTVLTLQAISELISNTMSVKATKPLAKQTRIEEA